MYRFIILFLAFGCASKNDTGDSGLTAIEIDADGGGSNADDGGGDDGGDDDGDDDGGGDDGGSDDGGSGDDGGGDDGGGDDGGGDDGGGDDGDDPVDDCGDSYEPNDSAADAHELGDIEGTTVTLSNAYMATDTDQDRFSFYVEDGWFDWFDVSVRVTDVPADVDLKIELIHVERADGEAGEGPVAEADDAGTGGMEEMSIGEGWWPGDQSGWYNVVVTSTDGSTCTDDYKLIIAADSGGLSG